METNYGESRHGGSSSSVYEIPGEPAIVINGVPNVAALSKCVSFQYDTAKCGELETSSGFGELLEGRGVRKLFGEQFYSGTVTKFDRETGWYSVVYEDGDFEDLEWRELEQILVPLDITVPVKQVVSKMLKKNEKGFQKAARITSSRRISSGEKPTRKKASDDLSIIVSDDSCEAIKDQVQTGT
ncbi:hypothetical protein Syun_016020 [Stephania yunnanensis]|uniref:PTM/DIR17-like Tudor domain-containing protein n=1 Tax=Stephania yunnanensis TaxID=152371 RepID=A0AAP0P1U7_9MAGN